MTAPFFYIPGSYVAGAVVEPVEETGKHIVQVLRMREGDACLLTDGLGTIAHAKILTTSKRSCTILVSNTVQQPSPVHQITIGISLLKNASRFEWFVEKAAETGISTIVPLICSRTEKQRFRQDRAQAIAISAMQQSQQSWLTEIKAPEDPHTLISSCTAERKFIAHCMEDVRTPLVSTANSSSQSSIILIGPEGDFTPEEVKTALAAGYEPVILGSTRLRTETAGITAAILLRQLGI
jgi:16S rRNA (uracil1498-N3)-methyltransferase